MTDLYLDLIKRALNNYLYLGADGDHASYRVLDSKRYEKFHWKIPEEARPHTLLSYAALDNLERMMNDVVENRVAGDFIEAGTHRGGAAIFMSAYLRAHALSKRRVWVADTFSGIPLSKKKREFTDLVDLWPDRWTVPLDVVKANFKRYGLLDKRVRFLRGPFARTLTPAKISRIAVAHVDCDSYQSTLDALTAIYPRMSVGGWICIDDWHLAGCRRAVLEFRRDHHVTAPLDLSVKAAWKVGAP